MWLKLWVLFFSRFGFPHEILSYHEIDFTSQLMQVFLNEFSVQHNLTRPYHPQSNGASEHFNGTTSGHW